MFSANNDGTKLVFHSYTVLAKTSPHVLDPALFALHIGLHFVTKYEHLSKSVVTLQQSKWSRIPVNGKDHKHSFVRDGEEKLTVKVEVDASEGKDKIKGSVVGGLKDLLGNNPPPVKTP